MTATTTDVILALDVGEKRVGAAIANQITRLPKPLITLSNDANLSEAINNLIKDNDITKIVVGLPRNLSGQVTDQTKKVKQFVDEIKKTVSCPIVFQDETLTSVKAEEELRNRGVHYNKGHVDALAATFILEDYLRAQRGE